MRFYSVCHVYYTIAKKLKAVGQVAILATKARGSKGQKVNDQVEKGLPSAIGPSGL